VTRSTTPRQRNSDLRHRTCCGVTGVFGTVPVLRLGWPGV
jgi:hypothetical protein